MATTSILMDQESTAIGVDHTTTGACSANSLRGVRGWLKFFIVAKLYISPVLFVLNYFLAWIGFALLAQDYPGIVLVGTFTTVMDGFLVWRWIRIAQHLRDIEPGAVQETKTWMKLSLLWVFFSMPLGFMSGLDAATLLVQDLKAAVGSLVGFAIWYSYFSFSRRVRATYPDWNA